jgi:hypothetical protein
VVYPAFERIPVAQWADHHSAHTRRIGLLVGLVYPLAFAACAWVVVAGPRGSSSLLAVAATAVAFLLTMTVAAPAHGRLAGGRTDVVLHRLLVADRLRCGAAVTAALASVVAALS